MKFSGPEQVVRFAYNIGQREIASRPNLTGDSRGSGAGLSPHELHAQGAMILAAVERLPAGPRAALEALLAPKGSEVGSAACQEVAARLRGTLALERCSMEAITQVLAHWTGRAKFDVNRYLVDECGIAFRKARAYRDTIIRAHHALYLQAIDQLDGEFFAPGGFERK